MRRREFISLAGMSGAALAMPRMAFAAASNLPKVALLSIPQPQARFDALAQGLADHGYVDGKTMAFTSFIAPTNNDLPAVAAAAVAAKPDVIVTNGTPASLAGKAATSTIPIVFTNVSDPLAVGLVASLAHPGGNVTGNSLLSPDLVGKQLQILKEIVPDLKRIAALNVPSDAAGPPILTQVRAAGMALGIEPVVIDFVESADFARQFSPVADAGVQAVYTPASTYLSNNRDIEFDLLLKNKLPAMAPGITDGSTTPFVGIVCYGTNVTGLIRAAGSFVDAVLKGTRPQDLPVEQPTVFDFAVNLDMARKIGVTIPPSILAQATIVVDEDWRAPKAVGGAK